LLNPPLPSVHTGDKMSPRRVTKRNVLRRCLNIASDGIFTVFGSL